MSEMRAYMTCVTVLAIREDVPAQDIVFVAWKSLPTVGRIVPIPF